MDYLQKSTQVPCTEVVAPHNYNGLVMNVADRISACTNAVTSHETTVCRLSTTYPFDYCLEVEQHSFIPELSVVEHGDGDWSKDQLKDICMLLSGQYGVNGYPNDTLDGCVMDSDHHARERFELLSLEDEDADEEQSHSFLAHSKASTCENPNKFVHDGKDVCWDAYWRTEIKSCGIKQLLKPGCGSGQVGEECRHGLNECQRLCLDDGDCSAITYGNYNTNSGGLHYPSKGFCFHVKKSLCNPSREEWEPHLARAIRFSTYIKTDCTKDHDEWSIFYDRKVEKKACSSQVGGGNGLSIEQCRAKCRNDTACKGVVRGKGNKNDCKLLKGCNPDKLTNGELEVHNLDKTNKYDTHFKHARRSQVPQMKHIECK